MTEQRTYMYRISWIFGLEVPLTSMKMQRHVHAPQQGKAFVKVTQGLLSALRAVYGGST